jgi:hypothetical protein
LTIIEVSKGETMQKRDVGGNGRKAWRGYILAGACASCPPSLALQYEVGEWDFSVDTSLTGAAQWRTESRDRGISGVLNDNDGNNNFDTGLVSAKGSFILELGGRRDDFAFFIRTDGLYDYMYEQEETDLSQKNYLTYNGAIPNGGDVKRGDFPDETLDEHGKRLRLLEAFVNYQFELGEQRGSVRLGRQVIAWGTATIYQGVNALQNPIDGGVALSPGVEAKEIFLPTAAVDLKWSFNPYLSAEAYYKLDWDKSTLPGVGSFLSTSDITGPGAQRILLGPLGSGKVISAEEPDEDGQWGVVGRYTTEGGSSFSLSYTNSHANIPGARVLVDFGGNSTAREVYLEDIEVWQGSIATNIGEAYVYTDIAYSENAPFVNTAQRLNENNLLVSSDVERGHYWQAIVGMTDIYTAFPWLAEQIILNAELTYQHNNLGEGDIDDTGYRVTDDAWGYQFLAFLKYFSVIPGMDMEVPISFKHDVDGYGNANAMNNGLKEDQKTASLGVTAFYLTNWEFAAKYSWYFGNDNPEDMVLSDRDNIALSVKYKF